MNRFALVPVLLLITLSAAALDPADKNITMLANDLHAIGRLAGAVLVSLGAASWWARHDRGSPASRGLVRALLIYNAAVVALVLSATFGSLVPLLWAVVVLHGAMAIWCLWSLRISQ